MKRWMTAIAVGVVLAGCGSDSTSTVTESSTSTSEDPAAQLTSDAETWASLFGTNDPGVCDYFQPESACNVYLGGNLTAFQRSYAAAKVVDSSIDGVHARVQFDNGDTVVFFYEDGRWKAQNLGGNLVG